MNTKFYKYYFRNLDKPLTMEAEDKKTADQMLVQLSIKSKVRMKTADLIDVRIETPLFGITTKTRNDIEWVWVGKEKTSDGWLELDEYERIEEMKIQQQK
jgi:hypothetical protein